MTKRMDGSLGDISTTLECGNNAEDMKIEATYKYHSAEPTDGVTPPQRAYCEILKITDEHGHDAEELLSAEDVEYLQELALTDAHNG